MFENLTHFSNSPIFIVGTPRSGTTLLAGILGRHSKIFIEGEFHFFDDIYSKRQVLGHPSEPGVFDKIYNILLDHYSRFNFYLDQRRTEKIFASNTVKKQMRAECSSYKDIFSFFMNIQAYKSGKIRWGNQVPRDLFNIPLILNFYNDAKIIVCVRDIRDFLLSYKCKWRNTSQQNIARIKAMYHPIVTSLLWKLSVRKIADLRRRVPEKNFEIIRYEDLVNDPEKTIRHVCKTIGENFENPMIEIDSDNSSFGSPKGIFKTSVGRWVTGLTCEEAVLAQWIGGEDLKGLGYSKGKMTYNPIKLATVIMSTPIALMRAFKASGNLRGPLLPYLKKRLGIF
jgi:hypothetical protein